ncbi:uncharacterized protein LOC119674864 [Teleopsis dalmanni]|uniref:uncharacterized protein LOC119674864 n=1 Tax=Teleopsis dalmanni TaxID=139649 RepID=UPI0018CD49AF|nr:uncharacterized protein LOC119674864 [Teleopsis dalmanni]
MEKYFAAHNPKEALVESDVDAPPPSTKPAIEPTVRIKCLSGAMLITIKDAPPSHESGLFNGMVYPKGLSKNSTCLTEYRDHEGPLRYKLPLRSCNTMPQETINPLICPYEYLVKLHLVD